MRRLLVTAASLACAAFAHAGDTPSPAPKAPQVHNIAMSFVRFWDADKDQPAAQQLADFKKEVAPGFPGFYDIARFDGEMTQQKMDEHIAKAIAGFPEIRDAYIRKASQFEDGLPGYIAGFKKWFPDFEPTTEIYVLNSLGEMDGGTRTINGHEYLIFGIDGMVRYHGNGNEAPFFDHELFHTYHYPAVADCEDETVWASLWREGLATYVSKVMNPTANDTELLLTIPNNMAERTQQVLSAALAQLESVLDNKDHATYAGLFNARQDATGLPPRRGYYLGYLVAKEAAKTHDLHQLAKLNCGQVHDLVFSTVKALRASHP